MISYVEALEYLRNGIEPLSPVTMPISQAVGSVCAETVISSATIPPFINSAMDGFAILARDTSPDSLDFSITGSTVAGDSPSKGTSGAWEIMTGAPLPSGYDSVVKIEDVTITQRNGQDRPERIRLASPVSEGANVRKAGEDFTPGMTIIEKGATVSPFHIMAMAAAGIGAVSVAPRARITVFSTGREVMDGASVSLQPGQIRNSNSPYLMAALEGMHTTPTYGGIIHDEPETFEERVRAALDSSDLILSTGAVSAGRHDFIPDSLKRLGATIRFHKVAIRPGKPILYARFASGTHYIGLPGNPVSSVVGLRFFATPLLRHLLGARQEILPQAVLAHDVDKDIPLRFFLKACVFQDTQHRLNVRLLKGQESFKIHPLLEASAWAVLPEETGVIRAGTPVSVASLAPGLPLPLY